MGGSLRGGWTFLFRLRDDVFLWKKNRNRHMSPFGVIDICRLSACLTAIINRKGLTCALLGMAWCTTKLSIVLFHTW
jgi:hypothetical protein